MNAKGFACVCHVGADGVCQACGRVVVVWFSCIGSFADWLPWGCLVCLFGFLVILICEWQPEYFTVLP